jgi:hypothetical protein
MKIISSEKNKQITGINKNGQRGTRQLKEIGGEDRSGMSKEYSGDGELSFPEIFW